MVNALLGVPGTLIALLALAIRVVVVLETGSYVPNTDASDFDRIAVALARTGHFPTSLATLHGGPTALRPPLFSMLLSVVYRLVGTFDAPRRWEAGRMMEALLGVIAVWLIYAIVRRLWPSRPRIAVLAGLIAAVYPPLILIGSSLLSESLFIPLALGATYCGLRSRGVGDEVLVTRSGAIWWAISCGVFVGLTAMARPNGIIILLPLVLMVIARHKDSIRADVVARKYSLTRLRSVNWRAALALLIACAITLTPWTVRNYNAFHTFVPISNEGGYDLAGIYNQYDQNKHDVPYVGFWGIPAPDMAAAERVNPNLNEAQMANKLTTDGIDYIKAHPFSVARESYWNLLRMLDLAGMKFERYGACRRATHRIWRSPACTGFG